MIGDRGDDCGVCVQQPRAEILVGLGDDLNAVWIAESTTAAGDEVWIGLENLPCLIEELQKFLPKK